MIISSVVFALFHGTQNVPLFIDRLAFGLLAAILVWKTGGLEAGIAAHVVNNVFAYTIAGLTGSIAELRAIQQISWSTAAFDVGGFALFAAAGVSDRAAAEAADSCRSVDASRNELVVWGAGRPAVKSSLVPPRRGTTRRRRRQRWGMG